MQNRKSYANATAVRATIAVILGETSYLQELSYADIAAHFNGTVSTDTVKRHVSFLRREFKRDGLRDFLERVKRARQGYPSPFDGTLPASDADAA